MALADPTQLSTVIADSAVAGTDTFALTMTAGRTHVLLCAGNQSNKTISACSDNLGGNTWTQVVIKSQTTASTSIWVCKAVTGGSATVSTTFTTAVASNVWYLVYGSDELTGSVDKFVSGNSSTLPATTTNCEPSAGTGTLASADQICFEAMGFGGAVGTWTKRGSFAELSATGYRFGWQVVTATTAVTGGGTYTTARTNSICLATFPGTPAAPAALLPYPPHLALQAVSRSASR